MRKYIKKRLLDMLDSLYQAHETLSKQKQQKCELLIVPNLQELQACAIQVGTTIEQSEGEGTNSVFLLENYCEMVYQASLVVNDQIKFSKANLELKKYMMRIIQEVKGQIPEDKVIVVFLPYKAAMWDSFESVWQAAKEDENCNSYVIPIPYYEKNSDGSFGKFIYEGSKYPKYIPITNWEDVDLETLHPDIIYFHNPYDKYNLVTSVHPKFYSEYLRQVTGNLIYIPYYCCGGSQAQDLYQLPSYYRANRIIVQSPKLVEYFSPDLHHKLLAHGSPKFDPIINFDPMRRPFPEEWKNKAKGKAVFFFNTSITSILEYSERAIEKIKEVLEFFKRREDIVLLWRSHPLLLSALRSVRPQLLKEFEAVIEDFKKHKYGIYDEAADVTIAVNFCDAYIGEETSSIVHLFGVMGKPIFLLSIEQTYEDYEKIPLHFYDAIEHDNEIWFPSGKSSALYSIKKNGDLVLQSLGQTYIEKNRLFNRILSKENILYLIPYNHNAICEYNSKTKEWKTTEIKNAQYRNFSSGCIYEDYLYLIPAQYDSIVAYHLKTRLCTYYNIRTVMAEYEEQAISDDSSKDPLFFNGIYQKNHLILMASTRVNRVFEFNINTKKITSYEVGEKGSGYWGMTYDGENFWLIGNREKRVVKWNYATGEYKEYTKFPIGFKWESQCFFDIVYFQNKLIVFPKYSNKIIEIDKETGNMVSVYSNLPYAEGDRKSSYYQWPSNYYLAKTISDEGMIAMSAYDNSLLEINKNREIVRMNQCLADSTVYPNMISERFMRCGSNLPFACREKADSSLRSFVNYVKEPNKKVKEKQLQEYSKVVANMDGSCGKKIHQTIMNIGVNYANLYKL